MSQVDERYPAEVLRGWSAGNPFYYGYGFDIVVDDGTGAKLVEDRG